MLADHLKLNFPAAFTASNLAWSFIEFQQVWLKPPVAELSNLETCHAATLRRMLHSEIYQAKKKTWANSLPDRFSLSDSICA